MQSFAEAEAKKKPNPELLFSDVYKDMPKHIEKQLHSMKDHVNMYKEHYPTENYDWKD